MNKKKKKPFNPVKFICIPILIVGVSLAWNTFFDIIVDAEPKNFQPPCVTSAKNVSTCETIDTDTLDQTNEERKKYEKKCKKINERKNEKEKEKNGNREEKNEKTKDNSQAYVVVEGVIKDVFAGSYVESRRPHVLDYSARPYFTIQTESEIIFCECIPRDYAFMRVEEKRGKRCKVYGKKLGKGDTPVGKNMTVISARFA